MTKQTIFIASAVVVFAVLQFVKTAKRHYDVRRKMDEATASMEKATMSEADIEAFASSTADLMRFGFHALDDAMIHWALLALGVLLLAFTGWPYGDA